VAQVLGTYNPGISFTLTLDVTDLYPLAILRLQDDLGSGSILSLDLVSRPELPEVDNI
jgi:hypothetical protein